MSMILVLRSLVVLRFDLIFFFWRESRRNSLFLNFIFWIYRIYFIYESICGEKLILFEFLVFFFGRVGDFIICQFCFYIGDLRFFFENCVNVIDRSISQFIVMSFLKFSVGNQEQFYQECCLVQKFLNSFFFFELNN